MLRPARRPLDPALMGAALMTALTASCATIGTAESVEDLILRTEYRAAVELAEERAEASPVDAQAKRDLDRARVALLLDRARDLNFEGRFQESLDLLDQAEALIPEQPQVATWRTKNLRELAAYHRDVGREAESSGDFEAAYLAFLEASRLDPSEPAGRNGAERVLLRDNYRRGLGGSYYKQGVKALREYRTTEASQNLDAADKYLDGDSRLEDRREEAKEQLAAERVAIALELEQQGLFRAARNEYRLALLIDEEMGDAQMGLDRCSLEVEVLEFLDEAERELRRNDFEQARVRIERAAQLTQSQSELVETWREKVEVARIRNVYETARELESDFEYPDAIATYDELLGETEGFYEDALARRDTLEGYIEQAAAIYARANRAETLEEQESLLYQITLFWPTYRDVRDRYAAVRQRLDEERAAAAAAAETTADQP